MKCEVPVRGCCQTSTNFNHHNERCRTHVAPLTGKSRFCSRHGRGRMLVATATAMRMVGSRNSAGQSPHGEEIFYKSSMAATASWRGSGSLDRSHRHRLCVGAERRLQESRPARHRSIATTTTISSPMRRRMPKKLARSIDARLRLYAGRGPGRLSEHLQAVHRLSRPVHRQARRLLSGAVELGRDRGDALRAACTSPASRPARPALPSTSRAQCRSRPRAPRRALQGYHLLAIVKKDSPYQKLADLKGKRVAHTAPSSNSGNLAPRVLYPAARA